MKYEFSLVLDATCFDEEGAEKLYEAGCDDASILTRDGVTRIQFDRISTSLDFSHALPVGASLLLVWWIVSFRSPWLLVVG
jgi:hypothetical protein